MSILLRCVLLLALLGGLEARGAGAKSTEPGVILRYDPDKPNRQSSIVWLAYLVARTAYREKHHLPTPTHGEIVPSFGEEADARSTAAKTYGELKAKDPKLHDAYWEVLLEVERRQLMPAYVWTYVRRSAWPTSERPANLAAFDRWKEKALRNHRAETYGSLEAGKP